MLLPDTSKLKARASAYGSAGPFDPLAIDCPPTDNAAFAEYCMIGDAPSAAECLEGQPFTGPAGGQLNRVCNAAGLPRYNIYLTNACKAKLPGNNTNKLWTDSGKRCPEWGQLQSTLLQELTTFQGTIIICMGATAMHMLLDHPKFDSINKYRGSIYRAEEFPHLAHVLPGKLICLTLHPSSSLIQSNPLSFWTILFDIQKFIRVNKDPSLMDTEIKLITQPVLDQILGFMQDAAHQTQVGFDIEATPKFITCFALAFGNTSLCVPLMNNSGNMWSVEDEVKIWDSLAKLLSTETVGIICQNGMFDLMFLLRTMQIKASNFFFDTMIAQHICYTDLPKGLDYLTSVYTYFPYYKDEGKQSHLSVIKDWPMYWEYNAKDALYLLYILPLLQDELCSFDALDAMNYSMALHKPLMEMEWNGILTDRVGISVTKKKFERYIASMTHGLKKISKKDLNINSPKQLIAYFYGELQIKPYMNRTSGRPTCDAVALSRIARKKLGSAEARLILKIRHYYKLLSTYFNINVDEDNKLRCTHKITGTVSGRIATEKTFFGTGANLQNQPPEYKEFLIADPEHFLCEVDLAKAEAHVVAYVCQDINMMEAFDSGVDVHTFNASKIFNIPLEQVTKHQRFMGKKVVHASNYGMGPQTFSDNLAKDGTYMTQAECRTLLTAYTNRFPGLPRWHKEIELQVSKTRVLTNLFGRQKRFLGVMNSALFRNAYSYIPQSTVAELLNRGLIKIANDPDFMFDSQWKLKLLVTVHDSLVFQFHQQQIPHLAKILCRLREHLTYTFHHKGRSFTIGVDAKFGRQWAGNTVETADFSQTSVSNALAMLN